MTGSRAPANNSPCFIDKATSALYTPKAADADADDDGDFDEDDGYVLYALVGYKDNKSNDTTYAMMRERRGKYS